MSVTKTPKMLARELDLWITVKITRAGGGFHGAASNRLRCPDKEEVTAAAASRHCRYAAAFEAAIRPWLQRQHAANPGIPGRRRRRTTKRKKELGVRRPGPTDNSSTPGGSTRLLRIRIWRPANQTWL